MILDNGITGKVRKKLGNMVGANWKNKNYVRSYVQPAYTNTAAQIVQRDLFKGVVAWAVGILNVYVDPFCRKMSAYNYIIKKNITYFVSMPEWYSTKICFGKLYPPQITDVAYVTGTGVTTVTFGTDLGANGKSTDKVMAAVFCSATGRWYFAAAPVDRSVGSIVISCATGQAGEDLQCYTFGAQYVKTILKMVSNSSHSNAS
jgi:hypothetical protein